MARAGELPDPEWVMVGAKVDAGVRLFASKTLPRAAFEIEQGGRLAAAQGWHLDAILENMIIITKPTWGECMSELLRIWGDSTAGQIEGWTSGGTYHRPLEAPPGVQIQGTPSGQHQVYTDQAGRMLTPDEAREIHDVCGLRHATEAWCPGPRRNVIASVIQGAVEPGD